MLIPAMAPALSLLLGTEEVAVGPAEELVVTVIDKVLDAMDVEVVNIDEVLDAMDVEVINDDEADAVIFGFCGVTVRLGRMKYP
jgi:6-pyruvoyl-tetrahydropterin synthase